MVAKKTDEERVRRNKPGYVQPNQRKDVVALPEWDGKVRGPLLPKDVTWCEKTRKWYNTYRRSSLGMIMNESDWQTLLMGAYIHNRLSRKNTEDLSPTALVNMSAELRKITDSIGGSYVSRKDLGISVPSDKDAIDEDEEVTKREARMAVNYMERLLSREASATKDRPEE